MSGDRGPVLVVSEKNKGLNQAFASLQQAALPPNTVQVGNMLHHLNENTQGNKRGQVANKSLQIQQQIFGKGLGPQIPQTTVTTNVMNRRAKQ